MVKPAQDSEALLVEIERLGLMLVNRRMGEGSSLVRTAKSNERSLRRPFRYDGASFLMSILPESVAQGECRLQMRTNV